MPQVDLETLVSVCGGSSGDRKIACVTLAGDGGEGGASQGADQPPDVPPDFPPESFFLSRAEELDWLDRNAFLDRRDSAKGNSHSANLNPNLNPNSNSQRFSLNIKSKAAIIGLPKPQKTYVDPKNRKCCKPGKTRLFVKRSGSSGKSDGSLVEPSSPKVSCMGRVRSNRDRRRRARSHQRPPEPPALPGAKRRTGFLARFRAIFRSSSDRKSSPEAGAPRPSLGRSRTARNHGDAHDILKRLPPGEAIDPPRRSTGDVEPPGLGGLTRFASGRRPDLLTDNEMARS